MKNILILFIILIGVSCQNSKTEKAPSSKAPATQAPVAALLV